MKRMLVTGSSGLVGSEAVTYFTGRDWEVYGWDNGQRGRWFICPQKLDGSFPMNICDRRSVPDQIALLKPDAIIHCAAQPSHDFAAHHPFEDFDTNAGGTLNLLEAARHHCPNAPFVFLSTNKVYGDWPNLVVRDEMDTRYDSCPEPVSECASVDNCMHSLFGCSKLAADTYVQEYGRYFGMKTVCFRCGCITGRQHAAVEQHGFLAYIARCVKEERLYRIYGYKGKQVRDNLHAHDVCTAAEAFIERPECGLVYNLGGGEANSISVIEAIAEFERRIGKTLRTKYVDVPRRGDHICYISDTTAFRRDYGWRVTRSLDSILEELAA